MKDPLEIISGGLELPSLPAVYSRLDNAINSPRTSISEIGDILLEDPGLTARILRIANSAFYNFPAEIDTISRALTLIGTKQLRDLVLATVVIESFDSISTDLVSMDAFWRHSVGVGVSARVIATYMRESNVEYYFVMGLLHDIGRLLLNVGAPEIARDSLQRCRDTGGLLHEIEREMLGFDHADIGCALLTKWDLPPQLIQPIGAHHRPSESESYPLEAAIVHLADVLVSGLMLGSSGQYMVPPLDKKAWEILALGHDVFSVLVQQTEEQYHDAIKLFRPEMN